MRNGNNDVKHHRKWLAVLLVFSMIATLYMPTYSKAQNAPLENVPEGYIGIYDIADLYGIRNDLTANYILMKDIDMSEDTAEGGDWNLAGHGWTPIDGFAGTFDGNGHRIIGMHIYGEVEQAVGLFGKLGNSYPEKVSIKNLAMVDININIINEDRGGWCSVGGIVGHGYDDVKIENCYTTGDILAEVKYSQSYVGGLMGGGRTSSVSNCYNICNVILSGDSTDITDGVGGIAQSCNADFCYNIGTISRAKSNVTDAYPIVGNGHQASHCYALSNTANKDNKGCTVLFPTQLKDKRTLVGFDFDNVWEIDPYCDYPYPQLKSNRQIRIVSLDIVTEPTKTEYEQADSLDLSGGTVKITYEDETTATIPITEDMVSGYDMNLIGEQNVMVSYCGVSTTYPIIVKEVPLRGISLNQSKVSLGRNKSLQLSVNYSPVNASDKTVEWTSSDSSIGLVAQCQIQVLIPCATISLNKTLANMKVGETLKLTAQMLPLDTTDVLEWKTSNATVADVSSGTVTAYKAGTAKVTAYVENGVSVDCKITVTNSSTSSNNSSKNTGNTGTGKGKTASTITSVKGKISSIKSTGSKSIKLKLGNLGSADGYQIQYSLKKNFKNSKKIKKKSKNITIKKLKKNRRYYVRVRVYGKVNGKTYYGKWSARKSVKTRRK